ncbi:hypothetical protein AMTRI_Chr05g67190 [Amborella trichopoda]
MEKFGDDEVGLLLKMVAKQDRKSCSQVCKQWMRVEGLMKTYLRVLEPESLRSFLPRFPNLFMLEAEKGITDLDLEFIAKTCPNLEVLMLIEGKHKVFESSEELVLDAISDDGLCAMATGCRRLRKVYLRRRNCIGKRGVTALIKSSFNLTHLDLSCCGKITDEALEAIAASTSLQDLNLHGCFLITDTGLASLATGSSTRTLKRLDLSECDQISDFGVSLLRQLTNLEELSLSECGPKLTDTGGVAIGALSHLQYLNFSWLINISDISLLAIAQNLHNLVQFNATGCELITGVGIRAFSSHKSLEGLILVSCYNVLGDDIEQMVLQCQSLRYVWLDRRLRSWMSHEMQVNISRTCRIIWR